MGFLSKTLGGGKTASIKAAPFDPLDLGLEKKLKDTMKDYDMYRSLSKQFLQKIPTLIDKIGESPVLGKAEEAELGFARNTYMDMLSNAKLNVTNDLSRTISGGFGNLANMGVNIGGAGAANYAAGVTAQGQKSINDYTSNISSNLLNLRQNLLDKVYNRLTNQLTATSGFQTQTFGQANSILGTALNVSAARSSAEQQANATNAAMKASKSGGGIGGILKGVTGGAMAGFSAGGPQGAGVGAVLGGLGGLFGG